MEQLSMYELLGIALKLSDQKLQNENQLPNQKQPSQRKHPKTLVECTATDLINPRLGKILDGAVDIAQNDAWEEQSVSYLTSTFIQTTLPHKQVLDAHGNPATTFSRHNGDLSLNINSQLTQDISMGDTVFTLDIGGVPYGVIPRLFIIWLCTSFKLRPGDSQIQTAKTMSEFLTKKLGMVATGSQKKGGIVYPGTIERMKQQLLRLNFSDFTVFYAPKGGSGFNYSRIRISSDGAFFINFDEKGKMVWDNKFSPSTEFLELISKSPVPLDMRAVRLLQKSPMDLDVYCWLAHRLYRMSRPSSLITFRMLNGQFGSTYKRLTDFEVAFLQSLKNVLAIYPEAKVRVDDTRKGIQLFPSPPHVKSKEQLLEG